MDFGIYVSNYLEAKTLNDTEPRQINAKNAFY
jgi:hypothetical protein